MYPNNSNNERQHQSSRQASLALIVWGVQSLHSQGPTQWARLLEPTANET